MMALRSRLRAKDIWIENSIKYGNPSVYEPQDFDASKEKYCEELGCTPDNDEFVNDLKNELGSWLKKLNNKILRNQKVKITKKRGKPWIKVSPIKKKEEPQNIRHLKKEIRKRWSVSLLEILKETELRTKITEVFKSAAGKESIEPEELRQRILLCVFAIATNTGLKRIAKDKQELEHLRYVKRRYVDKSNLREAILWLLL